MARCREIDYSSMTMVLNKELTELIQFSELRKLMTMVLNGELTYFLQYCPWMELALQSYKDSPTEYSGRGGSILVRMPSSLQSTYKLPIMRPACGGNRRTQRAGKETDIKSHWIMAWPAWVSFKHASKIHANRIPTPEGLTHLSR
ncbi:Uncharacterized protein TCM_010724 [Theobroma cacao]|uniref:Uncharacterized protein n=1 Tax=Theobroma cacao TaxID=3641 RepID=A0A061EEV6_THECC|nr:Uncharacterized protein TCM_010724 [Theobroma cacao]